MKKIVASYALVAVFALLAVATAKAETVVWYTFDDLTPGDTLANGTTVENKVTPGTHDATVLGLNSYLLKPDSTKMPICTNGIPESFRVFDPVSGTMSEGVDRALRFLSTWNTGDGAFLQVANDADLRPEAFTVEAMVWFPKDATSVDNWNVIAVHPAKMTCANADAWGFRFTSADRLVARFTRPREYTPTEGKVDTYDNVASADNVTVDVTIPAVNDGRWHHVAFTAMPNSADPTKTDVKVFFDYKQYKSSTIDFRPQFSDEDDCPVWIGSTRQSYGFFTGAIGEFRFSNVALTPDKFLRHHNAGMDKDCVLYYDFEAEEELDWLGATLGEVVNKAMPGIMDGSIVTNNNLAPAFVEGSPAGRIRQSMTSATYETSEKSLRNYITDADNRYNGYVTCTPLDEEWLSKTNFTVECFVNTDNLTQNYTALFQRWGGFNVQIKLGINGSGGSFGVNFSTNTVLQRELYIAPMTSGKWHHVALVVDQTGETKTLRGYLDHQQRLETLLESNLAAEDKGSSHDGAWYFAGSRGARSFDGAIDSMRVTLRALTPDEFLSIQKFPVGRTLAHVSFNDGTVNADPEGGTMVAGVNAAARNGGAAATFSGNVPGAIIRDGENGEIITMENTKSLSLSGSKVTWGSPSDGYQDTYYIRKTLTGVKRTSWTVEFWMKPNGSQTTWGRIITATLNNGMYNYYPFALTFYNATHLSLRSLAYEGGAEGGTVVKFDDWDISSVDVVDGKWHHVAFTYAPSEADPTKSEVKFYIDYNIIPGTKTARGLIEYPEQLIMHLGDGSAADYNGLIDELRISEGALEPSQFLRAERAPTGFSIIFR